MHHFVLGLIVKLLTLGLCCGLESVQQLVIVMCHQEQIVPYEILAFMSEVIQQ